jgi:UDP-N-acetyl-L-fucosamine synthase
VSGRLKPKVMTIVGTRPEIIRLSRIIPKLDDSFHHILVHTGQNTDVMLKDAMFRDLELRDPDIFLDINLSSLGSVLGDTLIKVEKALLDHSPDAVLILGDTNSAIAALMAKRMHIPVFHMEAGNRSFDQNVPEETNRRLVDHVSDFNLPYTEHARRNLLAEGLQPRRICVTGSPMTEVLEYFRPKIESSTVLGKLGLKTGEFFLVSAHRQENVDSPDRLLQLVESLKAIRNEWGLRVIVSTHPRTRKRLGELEGLGEMEGISFLEPFGFLDYNNLQLHAKCVVSDSGTIAEESAILGFPAVTIRDSSERPEAIEAGWLVMVGLKPDSVTQGVHLRLEQPASAFDLPNDYKVSNTSTRVVAIISSLMGRHHEWAGIRPLR